MTNTKILISSQLVLFYKHTHNEQLAETFQPITEKLSKTTEGFKKLSSSRNKKRHLLFYIQQIVKVKQLRN